MSALVGLCLSNAAFASPAEPDNPIAQYLDATWGPDRGYTGGQAYAIAQSGDGYLWIGTDHGLVRFDGSQFLAVRHPLSDMSPIGPVRGLLVDGDGALWVRVDGKHLLRYRDGLFQDVLARADVQITDVTAMALDNQGRILLAGLGYGILRYNNGRFETMVSSDLVPETVLAVAASRDGAIWIGTRDRGIYRLAHGELTRAPGLLSRIKVNALLEASNGGVWVGSDSGLFALDNSCRLWANPPRALAKLEVFALARDDLGNVWAGTSRGLLRLTSARQVSFRNSSHKAPDRVTSLYFDRDRDMWYCGKFGIGRLRESMFTTWSASTGLSSGPGGPLYVDASQRTWFAPLAGGLYWIQNGRVHHFMSDGLDRDVVYSITGGGREIWIGRRSGGLTELVDAGGFFRARTFTVANGLPQNTVYAVHRNRDGTVWAATSSTGLFSVRNGVVSNPTIPSQLAAAAFNSIVESTDGTMWFATSSGLASFARGHWSTFDVRDGLPSPYVQSIFEDSRQTLWIATTAGLALRRAGQIKAIDRPESLRERIFGIAEDGFGSLWFGTSDRMLRVNRDQASSGVLTDTDVQSYGVTDGLRDVAGIPRDRYMVTDAQGRVWISLAHGLAVADPGLALANGTPSAIRIDAVFADGLPLSRASLAHIPPGTRSVAFHFSSTNLSDPSRVRFRYKLDGSDSAWSEIVDVHEVTYRNLGPGVYRLRVIASSPEGLWNGPEATIRISIEHEFWQTLWFRAGTLVALLLIAVFLYHRRMQQITAHLNTRFQVRLAERNRIAQDLHDTLLQSFQGLMLRFQSVHETILSDPVRAKRALELALDRADQALNESRDSIQGIRSLPRVEDDLVGTLNELMGQLCAEASFALKTQPSTTVIVEGQPQLVNPSVADELCRIAHEALRNAFTHANARHIEAEVAYSDHFLRLRFRDDGVGIDPVILKSGGRAGHWGLTGMDEKARALRARLSIWSKPNAGTEIEVTIPARVAFLRKPRTRLFGRRSVD